MFLKNMEKTENELDIEYKFKILDISKTKGHVIQFIFNESVTLTIKLINCRRYSVWFVNITKFI